MKKAAIVPEARLRRLLPPVLAELGKTNRERLEALLPLFAEGKARLSECLKAAFPGKNAADALRQFTNFRGEVNTAAGTVQVSVVFQVDTNKKATPEARECWFESERNAEKELEAFSAEGTQDVGDTPVDSAGWATHWQAILQGGQPIRIFVSYAHANDREAKELVDRIVAHWRADCPAGSSGPDVRWLWTDWQLKEGRPWEGGEDGIRANMEKSDLCLFLASIDSLASGYVQEKELPYFEKAGKPIVPVRFGPGLRFDMPKLAELKKLQFIQHAVPRGKEAKSYLEIHKTVTHRERFAAAVLRGIAHAAVARRGLEPAFSTLVCPAPSTAVRGLEHRPRRNDEFFDGLVEKDLACYPEESHARALSMADLDQLHATKDLPEGRRVKALDEIEAWATKADAPAFFAVLGEVGIGKTTTLKQLTRRLLDRRYREGAETKTPLPIFIDLRLYAGAGSGRAVPTLDELLAEVIRHHWKGGGKPALTVEEIFDAVQNQGALILFDGLDEKIVHYTPEQTRQFVRELWRILPPLPAGASAPAGRGKLLLSCRSHYFKDVITQNSTLVGETRDGVKPKDYQVCLLLPFSEEQVRHYLVHFLGTKERADAALNFFRSVHNLSELSSRPFLLSLITDQLGELERQAAAGERIRGVSLYEQLVRKWLARDDGKHQFSTVEKLELMEEIAADMFADGARAWPWAKVEGWLGRFLLARPEIARRHQAKPAELLNEDFRTATFVLRPDDSKEHFRFAHSSLQEYFHARRLVRALDECTPTVWKIEMPSLETLDFVGQLLAVEDSPARRAALGDLLTTTERKATRVAFRYWLMAVECDYPEPELSEPAHLSMLDLENWTIRGRSTERPLLLGGANLSMACLNGARLEHVYLADAHFQYTSCVATDFVDVDLARTWLDDANFTGAVFHECRGEELHGAKAKWYEAEWSRSDLRRAELGRDFERSGAMGLCETETGRGQAVPTDLPPTLDALIRSAHEGTVTSCAWSPDGQRLASGSHDHTVRVWDSESGKCLRTFAGHEGWVTSCAWSPDGRRLASGAWDNTVRVWDVESGKCLRTFAGHEGWVTSCVWSPDGRTLASGAGDNMVRVWNAESGKCLRTFAGHAGSVSSCTWSPDGGRLASGARDNMLRVWDVGSGKCLHAFAGHQDWATSCAWSPDGRRLASGAQNNMVRVWDAESGKCLRIFSGHDGSVSSCAWSPDGRKLATGAEDKTVKVWDAESGKCLYTLTGHENGVNSCAWSSDGRRLASGARDSTVRVWDAESGKCLRTLASRENWVNSCAWSPDGRRLASGADDKTVRVWDAESGRCLRTLASHENWVSSCAWSPDGRRLASGSNDKTVRVWDAESGKCLRILAGHVGTVNNCVWSPDGRQLASGSTDKRVRVWDAESGKCLRTLVGHENWVGSCAWSPDGQRLVSGAGDNTVRVWDAENGKCLHILVGHENQVNSCAWSPDGRQLVSGSNDKRVRVWDAESGKCLRTLVGHDGKVTSCAWSPDRRMLASGAEDKRVRIWDAESGKCLNTLAGHESWVNSCAWAPDGRRFVSASADKTVRVWDAETWVELTQLAHFADGEAAALDPQVNKFLWASPGAWRHLAWRVCDPLSQRTRILPAEFCGPLPGTEEGLLDQS